MRSLTRVLSHSRPAIQSSQEEIRTSKHPATFLTITKLGGLGAAAPDGDFVARNASRASGRYPLFDHSCVIADEGSCYLNVGMGLWDAL